MLFHNPSIISYQPNLVSMRLRLPWRTSWETCRASRSRRLHFSAFKQSDGLHNSGTKILKTSPSFALIIQDTLLDAATEEFNHPMIAEKRSEWRISTHAELLSRTLEEKLFGKHKSGRFVYSSNLPFTIARKLGMDVKEVSERLYNRIKDKKGVFDQVFLNSSKTTLAMEPNFHRAALCATSTSFMKSAVNRSFPSQYAVEILSPFRMTEPTRLDFIRPVQTASFLHSMLSLQRHRVMSPLSVRLPNISSIEMAQLVAVGLSSKAAVPESWQDITFLREQMLKQSRTEYDRNKIRALDILGEIQSPSQDTTDLTSMWNAVDRIGFEKALTEINQMSPEILILPESVLLDDARVLFEQLKETSLLRQNSEGFWIYSPQNGPSSSEPVKFAFKKTMLRPLFDTVGLISYLRDTNVLLPRRLVLVGRGSESNYCSALESLLNDLDMLKPLAAWIDFVSVASTSAARDSSHVDMRLSTLIDDTEQLIPRVTEALSLQMRASLPRPSPRVGANEPVSVKAMNASSFMEAINARASEISLLSIRFHSLLHDRSADLLLSSNSVFANPRGGFVTILRVLWTLRSMVDQQPDANEIDLAPLRSHSDIMNLARLLLQVPDCIRDSEDDSHARRVAWHLVLLSSAAERVLIVGKHARQLDATVRSRLLSATCAAMDRLLKTIRCDINL